MKKRIISILMIMVMLFSLTGCKHNEDDNKVEITMYLWDKSMSREFTPWLETQFPDIDFTFDKSSVNLLKSDYVECKLPEKYIKMIMNVTQLMK